MVKYRQAVVIIHGMGEQRPMETLAGFVDATLSNGLKPNEKKPLYWNKPDLMSQNYEVRRLRSRNLNEVQNFIETDFYEYYWAHHMEGTKISHVTAWASVIFSLHLFLKLRWVLFLLLIIVGLYLGIVAASLAVTNLFFRQGWYWQVPVGIGAGLLWTMTWGLYRFIVQYLGDVARYLDPNPVNIKMRQSIRSEGVHLLKRLHDSGKYERIIVVGHSLGSMIAYDILRYTWVEYHARNSKDAPKYSYFTELIRDLEQSDTDDENFKEPPWWSKSDDHSTVERLQKKQVELWAAQRMCGNPWLVTDFITLGSPLRYADIFLNSKLSSFESRKKSRELLTCLPKKFDGTFSEELDDDTTILHHAAMFAGTRWTNLFFRTDWVGGRLQSIFGQGIKDIAIGNPFWPFFPTRHTQYWARKESLDKLVAALELDTIDWQEILAAVRPLKPEHAEEELAPEASFNEKVNRDAMMAQQKSD